MPAAGTAVTVVAAGSTPAGPTHDEQQHDATPATRFVNDGATMLSVRNTNAASRILSFFADSFGIVESTIMTVTIPGSATENGTKILGPFPRAKFNDHSLTESSSTGQVMFGSNGADADLFVCPFGVNPALFNQ